MKVGFDNKIVELFVFICDMQACGKKVIEEIDILIYFACFSISDLKDKR